MANPARPNFSVEILRYLENKISQLAASPALAAEYEAALSQFKAHKDKAVVQILRRDAEKLDKERDAIHQQEAELLMEWASSLTRIADRRSRLNRS